MDLSSQSSANFGEIMKMIESRMNDYDVKLQKLSPDTPEMQTDIATLSKDFAEFKASVWKMFSLIKSQMELLSLGLDRHEAYIRRKVILFHGIPEESNENSSSVITNTINTKMSVSCISAKDIVACHRLGTNRGKPRPILVRFHEYQHRHLIWNNKTILKGSGITISEFLTVPRHRVFMEARKHFGISNCWTADSKIIILLPDKSRRKIEQRSDLLKVITQFPVLEKPHEIPQVPQQVPVKTTRSRRK